jgi:hypothetical protein
MKLSKQTALLIIVIVLCLSVSPSTGNLLLKKSENKLGKRLIESCFIPKSQKNFDNFVQDSALATSAGSAIEFLATGNDFYVGIFHASGNNNFLFNVVYGGWNNSQTQIFKNGDYGSPVCVFNGVKVDNPTVQTKYKFVFSAFSGKLSGYANDQLKFDCKIENANSGNPTYWGFSSWAGGVNICPLPTFVKKSPLKARLIQKCFKPLAQKAFSNFVQDEGLKSTNGSEVEFLATGNDFYVGIFGTSGNNNFLYNVVYGGWNNSQTQVFRNGDYGNPICVFKGVKVDNTHVQTRYKFIFSPAQGKIIGFANNVQTISCNIGAYNAGSAHYWGFSSWTAGVEICPPSATDLITKGVPKRKGYPYTGLLRKKIITKCFAPKGDKIFKNFFEDRRLKRASKIEFMATGNDFHVGIFNKKKSKKFLFNIVVGGCNNTKTEIFKKGNYKTPICVHEGVKVKNINKLTKYTFVFNARKGRIVGFMEGKKTFVCKNLGKFKKSKARYWGFSSLKGGVNISPVKEEAIVDPSEKYNNYLVKKCFAPTGSQKFKNFYEDGDLKKSCGSKIEFLGTGNDFYVGIFDKNNSNKYSYAIVYGGWNNSKTKVFKGNFNNPICTFNVNVKNLNAQVLYKFDFNPSTGLILGFADGKKVFTCQALKNYKAGSAFYWGFSSYKKGVNICPPPFRKICSSKTCRLPRK